MVHFFRKKEDEEKNPSGCVYEKVVKSVRSIHSIENGKIVLFSCFSQYASNIHTLKCALFLSSSPCKQIIIIQSKTWFNWIRNWIFTSSLMESERKKRKGWFISIVIKRTRAHTHTSVWLCSALTSIHHQGFSPIEREEPSAFVECFFLSQYTSQFGFFHAKINWK